MPSTNVLGTLVLLTGLNKPYSSDARRELTYEWWQITFDVNIRFKISQNCYLLFWLLFVKINGKNIFIFIFI